MRVTVLYFAAARERAGTPREELELPDGTTAAGALAAIVASRPGLAAIASKLRLRSIKTSPGSCATAASLRSFRRSLEARARTASDRRSSTRRSPRARSRERTQARS
jgi:hypothetical protein